MKHVVVMSELQSSDIRPPELLSKLKELSIRDAAKYFGDPAKLIEVNCPACDSPEKKEAFTKHGFRFNQCNQCKSVYVSPRPSEQALTDYYQNSDAAQYRKSRYFEKTAESRRSLLLRSRINWIGRLVDEHGNPKARGYADIGTTNPLIFEEIKRLRLFDQLYSVDPRFTKNEVVNEDENQVEQASLSGLGAISAFEQLENRFSPFDFLKMTFEMLSEHGLAFLTTRTISGFDLQILWGNAPYIIVPEHLNLLSIDGINSLCKRVGFEVLELSTPGQLDVELVLRAILDDPKIEIPPFIAYVLNHRDVETHMDLQEFLQRNRLSSHIQVALIRKD
jgi:hypothetical protein